MTHLQIGNIFGLAYAQATTLKTAVSAFNTTGIHSTTPNILEKLNLLHLNYGIAYLISYSGGHYTAASTNCETYLLALRHFNSRQFD